MKERPILFSSAMVQAILAGRKSQTRRVLSPQPDHLQHHEWKGKVLHDSDHRMWCWRDLVLDNLIDFPDGEDRRMLASRCPYSVVGDHLWVRETWCKDNGDECQYSYRADCDDPHAFKWKPGMFMPRAASRLTLEISGVRVERLQEISETDAMAEGVGGMRDMRFAVALGNLHSTAYRLNYMDLWDSINGKKHPWKSNPFVWIIEFVRAGNP